MPDLSLPDIAVSRMRIGCAGWSIPSALHECFPSAGSHLERYAAVLPAVEINSSFYRPHRPATYARWRDSVPDAFRFSVKLPRTISHQKRLMNADEEMARFLGEVAYLEHKLGCILVQLPPSLRYEATVATPFFEQLRVTAQTPLVCEARHPSWFAPEARGLLASLDIDTVFADPPVVDMPLRALCGKTVYVRLHGSPEMYHSAYSESYLDWLHAELARHWEMGRSVWVIFDNTASGAALPNALSLLQRQRTGIQQYSEAVIAAN